MTNLQAPIRKRLIDFRANTPNPRWSSHTLNELFSFVVSSGGQVGDVLRVLYPLLGESELSIEISNFVKELASCAFATFQESYRASDMQWMNDAIRSDCSAAQAYLVLYSLPQDLLDPECVVSLFKSLAATPFWKEAIANLEDETDNAQVQEMLQKWLLSGVQTECRDDVKRLARSSG